MEDILFRAFDTLFKNYDQYGYYNENDVFKALALIIIRDMLLFDFDGYLEDRDIRLVEKSIHCILGEGCMFPLVVNENKCCL